MDLFKPSVFKLSSHGFLLIEHLVALSITSILVVVLTQFISIIDDFQTDLDQATSQEISALSTQLQKEAKQALYFSTNGSKFQIHIANETVPSYYISNHRLMRQVDGKGGEVALYHCENLQVTLHHDQSATLRLTTSANDTYDIYLSSSLFPLEWEELDEQ